MRILRGKKQRRAAAVVEMAIVTPILLTMVMGVIEFGWLMSVRNALVQAAREGTRTGSLAGTTQADMVDKAKDVLEPWGLVEKVTIVATEATEENPEVSVQVSVPKASVSLVGNFFSCFGSGTMTATCSMRKEGT